MGATVYIIIGFVLGAGIGAGIVLALKKKLFAGEYENIEKIKKDLDDKFKSELEDKSRKLTADLKEEFAGWKNEYNRKQSHKANRLNETERRLIQKEEERFLSRL